MPSCRLRASFVDDSTFTTTIRHHLQSCRRSRIEDDDVSTAKRRKKVYDRAKEARLRFSSGRITLTRDAVRLATAIVRPLRTIKVSVPRI